MRTRKSCRAGSSDVWTKVLSAKPNSAAIACIWAAERSSASKTTASWLPLNGRSVNTSAITNG
jgi:hypothetical protein